MSFQAQRLLCAIVLYFDLDKDVEVIEAIRYPHRTLINSNGTAQQAVEEKYMKLKNRNLTIKTNQKEWREDQAVVAI